jgi:hypothetical protein
MFTATHTDRFLIIIAIAGFLIEVFISMQKECTGRMRTPLP